MRSFFYLSFLRSDFYALAAAVLIALLLMSGFLFWGADAATQTPTLSVTVQSTLSFTVSTNNFANLTPGTPQFATSTLDVTTNNSTGWNVTLSGDNVNATNQVLIDGSSNEITDLDPEWIAASATTSAGNAAAITSGQEVLAFRVMSASGTTSFLSTSWWGTSDANFNASQLWAGIASSTNVTKIGDTNVTSGGGSALNTVQYYLDVPASQPTGAYSGGLTYTATVNP